MRIKWDNIEKALSSSSGTGKYALNIRSLYCNQYVLLLLPLVGVKKLGTTRLDYSWDPRHICHHCSHNEVRTRGNWPSAHRSELTLGVGSLWGIKRFEEEDRHPVDLGGGESGFICHVRPETRKNGVQAEWQCISFYCWITNSHTFSSLNAHPFTSISQPIGQKSGQAQLSSLVRISQSWNQGVDQPCPLSRGSGEEFTCKFLRVVGQIQFLWL